MLLRRSPREKNVSPPSTPKEKKKKKKRAKSLQVSPEDKGKIISDILCCTGDPRRLRRNVAKIKKSSFKKDARCSSANISKWLKKPIRDFNVLFIRAKACMIVWIDSKVMMIQLDQTRYLPLPCPGYVSIKNKLKLF